MILGIPNDWLAYQLDVICLMVGRSVERALADGKDIDEVLASPMPQKKPFRSLKHLASKRVKIPESGVW